MYIFYIPKVLVKMDTNPVGILKPVFNILNSIILYDFYKLVFKSFKSISRVYIFKTLNVGT